MDAAEGSTLSVFMDDEETPATADRQDGGWSVESNSVPPDAAPADTTLVPRGIDNTPPAVEATAEPDDSGDVLGDGDKPVEKPAPVVVAKAKTPAPAPVKKTASQRRIDELTRKNGDLARQAATREAELLRRLEALEKAPKPATVTEPEPKPAVVASALDLLDPPKYIDFDTDEAYTEAVAKWRKDAVEKMTARETALKTEITSSLDARLKSERQATDTESRQADLERRMAAMATAHPDFHDLVATNAESMKQVESVFLQDLIMNTPDGPEFLYDLASEPEMALALGALPLPTRPLADAVRHSPMSRALMRHFSTDEGQEDFLRLRALPPIRLLMEVGKLERDLETADHGGPAPSVPHPITKAAPAVKPPAGTPRAREGTPSAATSQSFEDWNADEDRKERAERLKRLGIAVPA